MKPWKWFFFSCEFMDEEIKKLDLMEEELDNFMKALFHVYNNTLCREVVFAGMVAKKAMDILDATKDAVKKYNITVQISLLRLLCDNCLAIQSAKELTLPVLMNMIQNNERANNVMIDETQNMSDGYLKRLVAEKYPGFDKVYRFACDSVHFSKQAMASSFIRDEKGNVIPHIEVGNKELRDAIVTNTSSIVTVTKIILDMLKDVCVRGKANE